MTGAGGRQECMLALVWCWSLAAGRGGGFGPFRFPAFSFVQVFPLSPLFLLVRIIPFHVSKARWTSSPLLWLRTILVRSSSFLVLQLVYKARKTAAFDIL